MQRSGLVQRPSATPEHSKSSFSQRQENSSTSPAVTLHPAAKQRGIGNQATLRLLREQSKGSAAPSGTQPLWNFSPLQKASPQVRESTSAGFKPGETRIGLSSWERARWTAGATPMAVSVLGEGRPLRVGERKAVADDVPLSDVRIHDDRHAQAMTALLGNAGFAAGKHIVLSDPLTSSRRDQLLAHELVHVLQQRAAGKRGFSTDPEQEAEQLAMESSHRRITAPDAAPQGLYAAPIAKYTQDLGNDLLLIIDVDDGDFVGGCVKAIVPHLGVKLVKKGVPKGAGNQLFNIHVGITENAQGESCFFFYESVSGLCELMCFPTLEELKKKLKEIRDWIKEKVENVLKFLLPVAIAGIVAYVIADAIVAALVAAGILVAA
jgi:hypothetical protein